MGKNILRLDSHSGRYAAAILLAIAAQIARIPLHPPTINPFVTYVPFILLSARISGFGPSFLTTILCTLESLYFALEPVHSFAIYTPANWVGIVALVVTGLVASVLSERLKRSAKQLAEGHSRTAMLLESVRDGFNTFDRSWNYTYVNAAAARMLHKTPEELLGQNLWEMWPLAADSPFGAACRKAVAENVPVAVEAFLGEPLNAWFEVRNYPSPQGLTQFFTDTTERRRIEEQLRLLSSAIFQTGDGILIVKVGGKDLCCPEPVFANSAFERITGFSLEDLKAGALPLLHGPGLNPHLIERPRAACALQCPADLEQRTYRKNGSEFWAEFAFRPLAEPDGSYTHCVWTCRDVTAGKRAAEESRLLSSIVGCSDDAIVSKNLDGIVLSWNQGAERIYGYSSQEMVGQSIARLVPPEHGDEFPDIMEYLRLGQKIEHRETERLRKDGRHIFVALTISPLRDDAGSVVGASVIGRDVTERRRIEKALAQSELRYRSLVHATTQIVWTTNSQGEVVDDLPMWREFTGQSIEEIQGWGWLQALHPDHRDRTAEAASRAVNNRSLYAVECRARRRDGEYRWMTVHGVPVLDEHGKVLEWVGTCADITDRILAEEEVRTLNLTLEKRVVDRTAEWQAANQELEAFAYSVSHDLRAPLRAVDGFSRILLEEYGPQLPAEAHRYLGIVRENALYMGNLIDGLLAFSRLGRQALNTQTVDAAELIRQSLQELGSEQAGRQVEINISEIAPCQGDPLLLKQVFFNLLSNALKYTRTRAPGRIEIGCFQFADLNRQTPACQGGAPRNLPENSVVYYVRDNGAGFDMRYADKLFGVFQRLHRAEEYEGTGVGLATVRRIINRHDGSVWAEAALDKGATFYFTLAANGLAGAQVSCEPDRATASEGPAARPAEVLAAAKGNGADPERS